MIFVRLGRPALQYSTGVLRQQRIVDEYDGDGRVESMKMAEEKRGTGTDEPMRCWPSKAGLAR